MISVSRADSTEDFITIAGFCDALGALDVELGRDHGVPAEIVMTLSTAKRMKASPGNTDPMMP